MSACICCPGRGALEHHVFYRQHIPKATINDHRNLVAICKRCHEKHHGAVQRIPVAQLPDSVFEFGCEVLGDGPAYEYLARRYQGCDARLEALK